MSDMHKHWCLYTNISVLVGVDPSEGGGSGIIAVRIIDFGFFEYGADKTHDISRLCLNFVSLMCPLCQSVYGNTLWHKHIYTQFTESRPHYGQCIQRTIQRMTENGIRKAQRFDDILSLFTGQVSGFNLDAPPGAPIDAHLDAPLDAPLDVPLDAP